MNNSFTSYLQTPIGMLEIKADENGIISILFLDNPVNEIERTNNVIEICKTQLSEYFSEKRKEFDMPLHMSGTNFQNKVWVQLQTIPFGKTITYLQMAKNLGDVKAIRAAASANGKNPFAIVVPCHRVVGSNNDLVGYAGGLWRKRWLLEHEQKIENGVRSLFGEYFIFS
ncbi:MAG TPA: methylated-DNA--[protein]-cysteine S-methyltransferase [Chitinophagales bacterium]|nr:methylated-DNA--[protein]-cysteine S-methyltransferase [Chitinophagales bacterium]